MFTILAHLSGALGLFFMGARFLAQHLKTLNSHRFRLGVALWTNSRWKGFVWGLVAGSVMQSGVVLTFVVVSMLKSDLVSPKRAFPILLGGNVGFLMLVLVVMLDIKLMALYVLGIAQLLAIFMARERTARYRAMATACFGLGMIVLGSIMLKESVVPLASYPWFQDIMLTMGGSLLLPLLSGLVLTFAMQSGAPVVVSGICMVNAGLIGIDQVLILFCGTCLGSSLILYLLTLTVTGRARQVAMYQMLHNVVLNALFVPLICIEAYSGVPLLAAAVRASGLPLEQGLPLCLIFFECSTAVVRFSTLQFDVRLVERWWPPTEVEALAKPQFIHEQALDDPDTALRMADLEQRRLLELLSRYLDAVRCGSRPDDELRESAKGLLGRIEEFLVDLAARCRDHEANAHNATVTRQKLYVWLEEQVSELCDVLSGLPPRSPLSSWFHALVEGIDVIILVLIDTLASEDETAWPYTSQLMGDRREILRKLRDVSLKEEPTLTAEERVQVLQLANIAEHVFLLISQLAHEYRQASGVDEVLLKHADRPLSQPRSQAPRDRVNALPLALAKQE